MSDVEMGGFITQQHWRPGFIRLSNIAIPHSAEAHDVFVDPAAISMIGRATPTHKSPSGEETRGEETTFVHCCHYTLWVIESPAVVAMLRDRALGHEHGPKTA